jgi:hypothetical protein
MRGLTDPERSVLEDAAEPPIDAELDAFMRWDHANNPDSEAATSCSPEEESAAENLIRRGCIVPVKHSWGRTFDITDRGRLALRIYDMLRVGVAA